MMKTIFKATAAIIAAMTLASCSDFLEEKSTTSLSEPTVYSTEEALESQLFGVYEGMNQNRLWLGTQYEFHAAGSGLVIWKGQRNSSEYTDQLGFSKYSATAEGNANMFNQLYKGINRCNRLLDNLPSSPVDAAFKTEIEAECKFVRAIFYFYAVRVWGDVPLILRSPKGLSDVHNPRTAWYKVYAQILDDISFAEQHMRDKARQESVNPGKGRPFNMAATALKASVYLTIGSMLASPDDNFWDSSKDQERIAAGRDPRTPDFSACGISSAQDAFKLAYDCAKDVMESGAYSLVPNYFKLFTWKDQEDFFLPERILMVQSTNSSGVNYSSVRMLPQYPPYTANTATSSNNWGRVRPERFYINEFIRRTGGVMGTGDYDSEIYIQTEDPRFDATFFHNFKNQQGSSMSCYPHSSITSTSNSTYMPYFRKYADPTYDVTNGCADCYVIRYAEMYLIRAEAAARLCQSEGDEYWEEAFDLIEELHSRARKSYDTWTETAPRNSAYPRWDQDDFATKEDLVNAIIWERFIEMGGECHEWFDTHRLGATWIRDNIAIPKNDFSELECNEITYMYIYYKLRPHPEDVQDIRKGLLNAYPEQEFRQNTSLDPALDQNDFYWQ